MSEHLFDGISVKKVFDDYVSFSSTEFVVKRIVESSVNCPDDSEKARKIAKDIIREVDRYDFCNTVLEDYTMPAATYRGCTSTEIVENFLDSFSLIDNENDRLFMLHQIYFGLNRYKLGAKKYDAKGISGVYADFCEYFASYKDKPGYTEDYLKGEILKTVEACGVSPRQARSFVSKAKGESLIGASADLGEEIKRLVCIISAYVYKNNNGEITAEEAVSLCFQNVEDIAAFNHIASDSEALRKSYIGVSKVFYGIAVIAEIAAIIVTLFFLPESLAAAGILTAAEATSVANAGKLVAELFVASLSGGVLGSIFEVLASTVSGYIAEHRYKKYINKKANTEEAYDLSYYDIDAYDGIDYVDDYICT